MGEALVLLVLVSALVGIVAYRTSLLILGIIEHRKLRQKYPSVEPIPPGYGCEIHTWEKAKLVLGSLPVDSYLVCTECGIISGKNRKLNGPGLEVLKNNHKIREERNLAYEETRRKRQEGLDSRMNALVKAHVQQFDGDLHQNIDKLQQFFRKSVIEVDSLYAQLNEELDDRSRR
jgi:hypothetical protein